MAAAVQPHVGHFAHVRFSCLSPKAMQVARIIFFKSSVFGYYHRPVRHGWLNYKTERQLMVFSQDNTGAGTSVELVDISH